MRRKKIASNPNVQTGPWFEERFRIRPYLKTGSERIRIRNPACKNTDNRQAGDQTERDRKTIWQKNREKVCNLTMPLYKKTIFMLGKTKKRKKGLKNNRISWKFCTKQCRPLGQFKKRLHRPWLAEWISDLLKTH